MKNSKKLALLAIFLLTTLPTMAGYNPKVVRVSSYAKKTDQIGNRVSHYTAKSSFFAGEKIYMFAEFLSGKLDSVSAEHKVTELESFTSTPKPLGQDSSEMSIKSPYTQTDPGVIAALWNSAGTNAGEYYGWAKIDLNDTSEIAAKCKFNIYTPKLEYMVMGLASNYKIGNPSVSKNQLVNLYASETPFSGKVFSDDYPRWKVNGVHIDNNGKPGKLFRSLEVGEKEIVVEFAENVTKSMTITVKNLAINIVGLEYWDDPLFFEVNGFIQEDVIENTNCTLHVKFTGATVGEKGTVIFQFFNENGELFKEMKEVDVKLKIKADKIGGFIHGVDFPEISSGLSNRMCHIKVIVKSNNGNTDTAEHDVVIHREYEIGDAPWSASKLSGEWDLLTVLQSGDSLTNTKKVSYMNSVAFTQTISSSAKVSLFDVVEAQLGADSSINEQQQKTIGGSTGITTNIPIVPANKYWGVFTGISEKTKLCPVYKWTKYGFVEDHGYAPVKKQTPLCLHSHSPADSIHEAETELPKY